MKKKTKHLKELKKNRIAKRKKESFKSFKQIRKKIFKFFLYVFVCSTFFISEKNQTSSIKTTKLIIIYFILSVKFFPHL